jgi:entry exclusion lipoprotein TrbK
MQTKFNWILLACATAALVVTGYKEMNRKPQAHTVDNASCTADAIKQIDSITERAIQSSKCAQLPK